MLCFRQVWRFMLPAVGMPCIPVLEDNDGVVQLAQNPLTNSKSKHIDVRHAFPLGTGCEERDIGYPRTFPLLACGFPNQNTTSATITKEYLAPSIYSGMGPAQSANRDCVRFSTRCGFKDDVANPLRPAHPLQSPNRPVSLMPGFTCSLTTKHSIGGAPE